MLPMGQCYHSLFFVFVDVVDVTILSLPGFVFVDVVDVTMLSLLVFCLC